MALMFLGRCLSGGSTDPVTGVYDLKLSGTLEPLDTYTLMLGQTAFHYEVRPGDSAEKVLDRLAYQINEASLDGSVSGIEASVENERLKITALDGVDRQIGGRQNARDPTDDLFSSVVVSDGVILGRRVTIRDNGAW